MTDKVDLSGVERELKEISKNLHKPFEDIDSGQKHKEILDSQNKFYKETLLQQSKSNKGTQLLVLATIMLVIVTAAMAYSTKRSVDLQANLYSPKITAQITNEKLLVSNYANTYEHKVWQKYWNNSGYSIPLYVEINNNGIVPFQLYNIQFESMCGAGNRGLLSFPNSFSKVVGVGTAASFTDSVYLPFNTTVKEGLPCEINFTIYGNDLVINKKITLIKDPYVVR